MWVRTTSAGGGLILLRIQLRKRFVGPLEYYADYSKCKTPKVSYKYENLASDGHYVEDRQFFLVRYGDNPISLKALNQCRHTVETDWKNRDIALDGGTVSVGNTVQYILITVNNIVAFSF